MLTNIIPPAPIATPTAHKAAIARNWAMNMDYIQGGAV